MIYINKGATNSVYLELSGLENTTCDSNYLFQFENEFDMDISYIYLTTPNTSLNKNRYDLFEIVESPSGSPTGASGSALLLKGSQYKYNIYSSESAIDINDVDSIIDSGVISTGRMEAK